MFEIHFFTNGQRKTIPLGAKYTEKTATELKGIIEMLLRYRDNGIAVLDKRTSVWIESATQEIREKLAKAGLLELPTTHTLKELWEAFLKQKKGIKQSTLTVYDYAEHRFFSFFDRNTDLSKLAPEDFEEWKEFLLTEYRSPRNGKPLVEATVAGAITKVKALFNWAVSKKWIAKDMNPLQGIGRGSFVNRKNDRFVTTDEYRRLLDACPCLDWRVIIALVRIGGLRCPSEVLRLKWTDINWDYPARFYVTSSKTERYAGKEGRVVPLFPELHTELRALFESESSEGMEYVINRYRDPERSNLGTQFARIVKMAGVEPIPRPFDNMRASRSTEVYAEFGAFYESKWIGHSARVARECYLQMREEDFERAVGGKAPEMVGKKGGKSDSPAKVPAAQGSNTLHRIEGNRQAKTANS
jgi:integrase